MPARPSVYTGGMFAPSATMQVNEQIANRTALGIGMTRQLAVPMLALNVAGIRTQAVVSKKPRRTSENGGSGDPKDMQPWDFVRARSYQITGVPTTPPQVISSAWQPFSIPLQGNAIKTGWRWPFRWSGVWGFGSMPVGPWAPGGDTQRTRPRWTKVFAVPKFSTLPGSFTVSGQAAATNSPVARAKIYGIGG